MSGPERLDLGALAALPDGDPRVAALAPHERAQLAAYREFLRMPDDLPATQVAEAERRLGAALDEAMGLGAPARAVRSPAPTLGERFAGWFAPSLRPAWAVAAVLMVAGGLWFAGARDDGPVMRGREAAALIVTERAVAGAIELSWPAIEPGVRYEVRVYGPDQEELARLDAGEATQLELAVARLEGRVPAGVRITYQVAALRDGDELALSRAAPLVLP